MFANSQESAGIVPPFGFESQFDFRKTHELVTRYWTLVFLLALAYSTAVLFGRRRMKSYPRFELRKPLLIWNVALAAFSVYGAFRTVPEFLDAVGQQGFRFSVCEDRNFVLAPSGLWLWLFVLSKTVELGDTAFIVLRKGPLSFLHVWHHSTVLLYCFYSYMDVTSTSRWFASMNLLVHSVMYSYYALKALSVPVPRQVSALITAAQLAQMAIGCYVNYSAFHLRREDPSCKVTDWNIFVSFVMYASYFVLFAVFFFDTYLKRKPAKHSLHNGNHKAD